MIHPRWMTLPLLAMMSTGISLPLLGQAEETRPLVKSQQTFASPDDAVKALVEAVRARDKKELLKVFGAEASSWLFTGDKVADQNEMQRFLIKYDAKNSLDLRAGDKAILYVGQGNWPFPAPVVKMGGGWRFDTAAGREEVINRRVGNNELSTIQTLRAIVDAQREYASSDADNNGFRDYAGKFRSSPGKKDGLYWPTKVDEPMSPLGPLLAEASRSGYDLRSGKAKQQAYHGYYYKILTQQGKDAAGGAYNYMVKGKLLGGFAVVAYPVTYGVSGVQTFVINHAGTLYEKNLGPATTKTALAMATYNPYPGWKEVKNSSSFSDM